MSSYVEMARAIAASLPDGAASVGGQRCDESDRSDKSVAEAGNRPQARDEMANRFVCTDTVDRRQDYYTSIAGSRRMDLDLETVLERADDGEGSRVSPPLAHEEQRDKAPSPAPASPSCATIPLGRAYVAISRQASQAAGQRVVQPVRHPWSGFKVDPSWSDVYRVPPADIPHKEDPERAPRIAEGDPEPYPVHTTVADAVRALAGYSGLVGLDIEADGLGIGAPLLALQLALYPPDQDPILSVLHWTQMVRPDGTVWVPPQITQQLLRPDILPIWHDGGRYDGLILARHGCNLLERPIIDTFVCERVLLSGQFPDEDNPGDDFPRAGLPHCLLRRLQVYLPDKEQHQKTIAVQARQGELPPDALRYCALDVLFLGTLFTKQWNDATLKQHHAMRLEVEVQTLVAGITHRGLAVDLGRMEQARQHYLAAREGPQAAVLALLPAVRITAGGRLSDRSLCAEIEKVYGLDPASQRWAQGRNKKREQEGKKPLSASISVSDDVRTEVRMENYGWKEVADPLDAYKTADSLAGRLTPEYLRVVNGRCYPRMLGLATRNLRMAAREPNLQQLARDHRDVILADPGMVFVSADLSQIETRIAAVVSKDEKLLAATQAEDIYIAIAAVHYAMSETLVTEEVRKASKVVVLALQYAGGWPTVRKQMLKNGRPCSEEEAKQKTSDYLDRFDGIKKMVERAHAEARGARREKMGLAIEMASGFHRVFRRDELKGSRFIPARISSLASVGFKLALGLLKDRGWGPHLAMVLHDEISLHVPQDRKEQAAADLVACLQEGIERVCPGVAAKVAQPVIGTTWSKKAQDDVVMDDEDALAPLVASVAYVAPES